MAGGVPRGLAAAWPLAAPLAAIAILAAAIAAPPGGAVVAVVALALVAATVASVHHAELIALRLGEPFGTLVLALAVTAIEVSLIVSMMLAGGADASKLARDTIYATVMIVSSGVVGLCILLGALRHREQSFRIEGAGPAMAALATLAVLSLILPNTTTSAPGPRYSDPQLVFVAVASLALWCVFVFFQTVRHRDYFLPVGPAADEDRHAARPSAGMAWASLGLLVVSLVAVVGRATVLSPSLEALVRAAGAPPSVIGIAIALLVLMPETVAAVRAALANRLQTSINLAVGSGLATIGLTVPAVVAVCIVLDLDLVLGLPPKETVLLALAIAINAYSIGSSRTNMMQGAVQLVVFAAFLFLSFVP